MVSGIYTMLREGTREAGVPAFSALQLKIQVPYCFAGFIPLFMP